MRRAQAAAGLALLLLAVLLVAAVLTGVPGQTPLQGAAVIERPAGTRGAASIVAPPVDAPPIAAAQPAPVAPSPSVSVGAASVAPLGVAGNIAACDTLDTTDEVYTLTADVGPSDSTCFNISADDVTLDCAGYTVTYAHTEHGLGVNASNVTGVTIKNCVFRHGAFAGEGDHGILLYDTNNSFIINNTVDTSGIPGSHGILLDVRSDNNTFQDNVVKAAGPASYGVVMRESNSTFNNTIINASALWFLQTQGTNTTFNNLTFLTANAGVSFTNLSVLDAFNVTQERFTIGWNKVSMNATNLTFLNVPANITLFGITAANPQITVDTDDDDVFAPCDATMCGKIDHVDSALRFNVPHFTAYSTVLVGTCGDVTGSINLTNDVEAGATCFNITASDVTIDCDDYEINFSGSSDGYGVIADGVNNVTVKRCNIVNAGRTGDAGVYFNNSNGSVVQDSVFALSGQSVDAVRLTHLDVSVVERNTINVTEAGGSKFGVYAYYASNVTVAYNNISMNGTVAENKGLLFSGSKDADVFGNVIVTRGVDDNVGIEMQGASQGMMCSNNTITTADGDNNHGIWIKSDAGIFKNNVITTGGADSNYGVYVKGAFTNTVENNSITTGGSMNDYGIVVNASDANIIRDNTIMTAGTNSYAIYNDNSNQTFTNTIIDDTIGWLFTNKNTTLVNTTFKRPQNTVRFPGTLAAIGTFDVTHTYFKLMVNYTFINTTNLSFMDAAAVMTYDPMYGDAMKKVIAADYADSGFWRQCHPSVCNFHSYAGDTFVFDVTHFTGYAVAHDVDAPVTALLYPTYALNYSGNTFNFTYNTTDLFLNVSCNITVDDAILATINSTTYALTNQSLTGFPDGTYYWNVTCVDGAANAATSATWPFTVDTVPPVVNITVLANGSYTRDETPEFNFTLTDNLAPDMDYEVIINGTLNSNGRALNNTPVVINLSTVPEGRFNVTVRGTDAAGNKGNTTYIMTFDRTAPSISSFTLEPELARPFRPVVGKCEASDALSPVATEVSGIDTTKTGSRVATCTATDAAGNTATANADYVIRRSSSDVDFVVVPNATFTPVKRQFDVVPKGTLEFDVVGDVTITHLLVQLLSDGRNVMFTIKRLGSAPLETSGTPDVVYAFLSIEHANMPVADFARLSFAIDGSWFTQNGLTQDQVSIYRWTSGKWIEYPATAKGTSGGKFLYEVQVPGLSYFIIAKKSSALVTPQLPAVPQIGQPESPPVQQPQQPPQQPEQQATPQVPPVAEAPAQDQSGLGMTPIIIGLGIIAIVGVLFVLKRRPPSKPEQPVKRVDDITNEVEMLNELLKQARK